MIWHSSSVEEIVEYYNSSIENGLNSKQVSEYKKKYGKNVIYPVERKSLGKCFLTKLASPTFLFGAIAALFYIVVDIITIFMKTELTDAFKNVPFRVPAVILFVLLVFELVVAFLETRVNKAIARTAKNLDCEVEVLDNGIKKKIKAKKLVPGDIIFLQEGDYIPADARLIESENLRCDESVLTGNVATVEKTHVANCTDIDDLSKRKNMIYAGCYIAFGSCKAIVTDTGAYTEQGKKLTYLMREENVVIPIQAKVKKVIAWVDSAMLVLAGIFFVLGIFMGRTTYNYREFVLDAALLFAVTIPCTYSLLVAFDVVLGLRRARRKKCDVKRISKLESICAANVIICDKTGTLTQNKMKAEKVYLNDKVYEVDNFAPDEVASMLKLAALTCDGNVDIDDFGREKHYGDIVETSILSAALKILKVEKEAIDNEYPRMSEIPFDSERKLKTVICLIEGKPYAIVKGTATTIIEKCNGVDKEVLSEKITDFSKQAYRVIGIAYKQLDELPSLPSADVIENDLTFSGLIAIANLPRFDAIAELENCKNAGIKTIMLTGDVIETAESAAKKLNLLDKDSICITGEDFEKMIMYYLLTKSVVDVTDEEITITNQINHRQVDGFMKELLATNVGDNLVSYISYSPEINAESVEQINTWLRRRNYPVLVFKDSRDLREGEVEFVATIEKAIYRMCCVGIIDDYTRDYANSQFRIVTKRKSDKDYFIHLKLFLMRYYTDERAEVEMQNALSYREDNAMQKCLGYITEFVYNKIATKRERAIRDIAEAGRAGP